MLGADLVVVLELALAFEEQLGRNPMGESEQPACHILAVAPGTVLEVDLETILEVAHVLEQAGDHLGFARLAEEPWVPLARWLEALALHSEEQAFPKTCAERDQVEPQSGLEGHFEQGSAAAQRAAADPVVERLVPAIARGEHPRMRLAAAALVEHFADLTDPAVAALVSA